MKIFRKAVSALLLLCLAFLVHINYAIVVKAADYSYLSSNCTDSDIFTQINKIASSIGDGRHYWNARKKTSEMAEAAKTGDYTFGTTFSPCACKDGKHSWPSNGENLPVNQYEWDAGYRCTSNWVDGGIQCCGFAHWMGYALFGSSIENQDEWARHTRVSYDDIEVGDIIRYNNANNYDGEHWVTVWYKQNGELYVADANAGGYCRIHFDKSYDPTSVIINGMITLYHHERSNCSHSTVLIGICQDCGAVIEDKVGYTVTQNCDQQMIPVNEQTTIRTTPYNSTAANAKSNGISLSKGEISYFHIIAKGRNSLGHEWYKLDYYEKTTGEQVSGIRYVYVDRVKAKPAPAPQPTAAGTVRQWGVNLRTGGSPYDSRILTIPAYAPVTVLPAKTAGSGWLNVRYNGSTGYASGEYINLTDADNSSGLKVAQGSITFKRGTVPQLTGKITSGKTITYVRAVMDELECFGFVNPGTSAVPLNQLQFIGNGLSGATSGRHTLVLTAMDAAGSVVNQTISVDVTEGEVVQAPTICISDAVEGKQITILNNTAGATVYYFLNDSPAGEKVYSAPLTVTESATIYAYAEKNGKRSPTQSQTISVNRLSAPSATYVQSGGAAQITIQNRNDIETNIYYSINNGTVTPYYGPFTVSQNCTVAMYCERLGYLKSDTASKEITLQRPDTPKAQVNADKIAEGDCVVVTWDAGKYAERYAISLLAEDGAVISSVETSRAEERSAVFTLPKAGHYQISVAASNVVGSSDSDVVNVEAMPDLTVTFRDYDGTVLSVQTVKYKHNVSQRPQNPTRRGYTFTEWDNLDFNNITEDKIYTAQYNANEYTVKFLNYDGTTLSTQKVKYQESAIEPQHPICANRYVFSGWALSYVKETDSACDFTAVDSDMTFQAVQCWDDVTLPVDIQITAAERNSETGNYSIKVSLQNYDQATTTAMLRVALKDSRGQMVKTAYLEFALKPSECAEREIQLKCSEIVSQAEAFVLGIEGNDKTSSALSKVVSATVVEMAETYGEWSDWSTTQYEATNTRQVESKTQYRYQDLEYTNNANATLDGWERYDSKITSWSDWSGWQDSSVSSSDSRQVETRSVVASSNYKPIYVYYRWTGGADDSGASYSYDTGYTQYYRFDHPLTYLESSNWYGHTTYRYWYQTADGNTVSGRYKVVIYSGIEQQWVSDNYKTQWRYRDAIYTHYFRRWSQKWSEWTDSAIAETSERKVDKRTVYRFREKTYETVTDVGVTAADPQTLSGVLQTDSDLSGKLATIMVYSAKNTDPNENQIQYIGQTLIGSGNTYQFEVIPKANPTVDSGDYIVSLGIQGASGLVNVGLIAAPKQEYTVTFFGKNGEEVNQQTLLEGENALLPEAPEIDGMQFVMWDNPARNVHNNLTVNAVYVTETYAVAFVDWLNQDISLSSVSFGESPRNPGTPFADGYLFDRWVILKDGIETDALEAPITDNTVVMAKWIPTTYTVRFFDGENEEPYQTQQVAYGESASLPDAPTYTNDQIVFMGWGTDSHWWDVKEDLDVYAITTFKNTSMTPKSADGEYVANLGEGVALTAADDAVIYYTTDGSDPVAGGMVYSEPLLLTEDATVKAIAVEPNKNPSEILSVIFRYEENDNYEKVSEDWIKIGAYPVAAKPNGTVALQVDLPENPGIIAYQFLISCDRGVFYAVYDEENGYSCEPGAASENGTVLVSPYQDEGYLVTWFTAEKSTRTGNLFTLTLRVSDEADDGTYPITVSYSAVNTITEAGLSANAGNAEVSIHTSEDEKRIGDVNGDGELTLADVILIARSIVGLDTLTPKQMAVSDVNGDTLVNNQDVIKLARYLAGLESTLR